MDQWREIEEQTWTSSSELATGIWCYKNVIPNGDKCIEILSNIIDEKSNDFKWKHSLVGYYEFKPDYRNCFDFKYKSNDFKSNSREVKTLEKLYSFLHYRQLQPVKDYAIKYNISELRYWESSNFVKYGPGQHFSEHCDHGFSYNCTLSLVAYPNDDYDGGELYFRFQDLKVKPDAGDLFIFPSNFMYPHTAMPVTSGTKYSIVTMLDYSSKFHDPSLMKETGS